MGEEGLIYNSSWAVGRPDEGLQVYSQDVITMTESTTTEALMTEVPAGVMETSTTMVTTGLVALTRNLTSQLDPQQGSQLDPPTSESCPFDYLPSVSEYHQGLGEYAVGGVLMLVITATLLVLFLYMDTIRHVLNKTPSQWQSNTVIVLSLYPVVTVVSLCAVAVPRAQFIMEAVAHEAFMIALYHMFCLVSSYCGGEDGLARAISPVHIDTRVGPCCCWPCCFFLPTFHPTKQRLRLLKILVLQAAVVQGLIYTIYLVIRSENEEIFQTIYAYMTPVVVASVLSSIWGLVMTLRPAFDQLQQFFIKEKFIVFQLVLVLTKLQFFAARIVSVVQLFPCHYPLTPTYYVNLIYNVFVSWEMVLLCFLARRIYKRTIETKESALANNLPTTIPSIQDKLPPQENIRDNNNSTIVIRF